MDTILILIKSCPITQTVNLVVRPFPAAKSVKDKQVVPNVPFHTSIMMVNASLNLEILSVGSILSVLEAQLLLKSLWMSLFSSFLSP